MYVPLSNIVSNSKENLTRVRHFIEHVFKLWNRTRILYSISWVHFNADSQEDVS